MAVRQRRILREEVAKRSFVIRAMLAGFLLAASSAIAQPVPIGPEFQVNSYTTGNQVISAAGATENGTFVVSWSSASSSGSDSDGASVQAQRFEVGSTFDIFADGFESGGTAAWSVTVP